MLRTSIIAIEVFFDLNDSFILTRYMLTLLKVFSMSCLYSNSVNLKERYYYYA